MTNKKTGPFDAAIECLGWHLTDMKACVGKAGGCLGHTKDIAVVEAAIRVLEAAGMVDKGKCLHFLDSLIGDGLFLDKDIKACHSLSKFVESLPDEEA